jgi:hypothetical protein
VSTIFYFEIIENIQFLTRKFKKINFVLISNFTLHVFLVVENLVSNYAQLLILTDIDASTLVHLPSLVV